MDTPTNLVYWVSAFLAVGLYVGVNRRFRRTILPRPAGRRSLHARLVEHCLPQWLVLASAVLLLQLAVAPLVLASAVLYVLLKANNKKVILLCEPLLPCDIALVLRHPHTWKLMLGYIGRPWLAIVAVVLVAGVIVAGVVYEPWLFGRHHFWLAALAPLPLAALVARRRGELLLIHWYRACDLPFWDWNLLGSVQAAGFFPTFVRCIDMMPRPSIRSIDAAEARRVLAQSLSREEERLAMPDRKPNIIIVLAEAFFDPRTAGLAVEPNPLVHYEEAVRRSVYHGRCRVPVFGGWTIRSEYSMLTGVSVWSFANNIGNPNSTLVRGATHALPKYLKTRGYRTVLVHPYQRQYYQRGRASLDLGFDAFLDEQSFQGAPREGAYVSDLAVAARIEEEMRQADGPTFLFCVTMENHGPRAPGIVPGMTPFTIRPHLGPEGIAEFAPYLHHLRNADAMIRRLMDLVAAADAPTLLLLTGDHLPSLPAAFADIGYDAIDERVWHLDASWFQTPYFLVTNWTTEHRDLDCDISFLPGLALDCAGLNGDAFFRENSAMRRLQNGNLHDNNAHPNVLHAYLRRSFDVAVFPERYVSMP